jgi:hypothetical protein
VLSELIGQAGGKGVFRALQQNESPEACEATVMPRCQEVSRQALIRSTKYQGTARTKAAGRRIRSSRRLVAACQNAAMGFDLVIRGATVVTPGHRQTLAGAALLSQAI